VTDDGTARGVPVQDEQGALPSNRIFEDNSACISIMTIANNASQSRHFEIKYFYTEELIERGMVELVKIDTAHELGDGFTKALPPATYLRHRFYIQGLHMLDAEELAALGVDALY